MPAAEKVRFLVSDVVERCQTGTNMEIHKSEVAMLYDVEPHGNGSGVVVAELKIDGVHRGIDCRSSRRAVFDNSLATRVGGPSARTATVIDKDGFHYEELDCCG